jgi:hypothetical protein
MVIRFCDRCHKNIDDGSVWANTIYVVEIRRGPESFGMIPNSPKRTAEFCHGCEADLQAFIGKFPEVREVGVK